MALAESTHHAALRGQKVARAGGWWERAVLHGQVPEHPTLQAAGAQHFAMDAGEDVGEAPATERPAPLLEVRPQGRVLQRTVELIVDPVPLIPLLHDVVPQMGVQLVDFLAPFDFRVAEQVIEVPKIVCPPRAARTVLRAPQVAEQLVEVPTEPGYSLAVIAVRALEVRAAAALAEHIVNNPVPQGRRGCCGGLPGSGQGSSAADVEQTVDIPVPLGRRMRSGGLQGLPGQDSTAFFGAERVDIPGGGLQGFLPGQGSSSSSRLLDGTDEGIHVGFSHFSRGKKVRG